MIKYRDYDVLPSYPKEIRILLCLEQKNGVVRIWTLWERP